MPAFLLLHYRLYVPLRDNMPLQDEHGPAEDMELDTPQDTDPTQPSQPTRPQEVTSPWAQCALGLSTLVHIMGSLGLQDQPDTLQDILEACTSLLKVPGIPGAAA